jgi:hypothetical protein
VTGVQDVCSSDLTQRLLQDFFRIEFGWILLLDLNRGRVEWYGGNAGIRPISEGQDRPAFHRLSKDHR